MCFLSAYLLCLSIDLSTYRTVYLSIVDGSIDLSNHRSIHLQVLTIDARAVQVKHAPQPMGGFLLRYISGEATAANRCRANMALTRQSSPDSGLGFQVKVLKTFETVPSGSAADQP